MAPQPRQVLPECAPDSHTHSAERDCATAQVSTNPKTGPGGTVPTFRCSPEMKGGRVSGWRQMPRRTPSRGAVRQSRTPCHHHQVCAPPLFSGGRYRNSSRYPLLLKTKCKPVRTNPVSAKVNHEGSRHVVTLLMKASVILVQAMAGESAYASWCLVL